MLAIVVDSTAYLTKKEARLYGIQVLSARYFVDGKLCREQYIDSPADSKLYSPDVSVTTRQTPITVFADAFRQLLAMDCDVICLTISSKMSSAYETAVRAAQRQTRPDKIKVIDSELTVGGLYALAKKARIYDREGFSPEQIAAALEDERKRIHIRFTVDDLSTLERSKRLGIVRLSAAPVLNHAPVFVCRGGAICLERTVRIGHDRVKAMLDGIPANATHIILNYIDKTECFHAVKRMLEQNFPDADIELRKIGPVVGVNIGRTMLAVIWEDTGWASLN